MVDGVGTGEGGTLSLCLSTSYDNDRVTNMHNSEIERCGIAIHLSIPMHRFIDAPIHRTDSNASFITDASGLNRCIGTELMNRFKIITDYYRCIGKNYQCIGNLAMHRI